MLMYAHHCLLVVAVTCATVPATAIICDDSLACPVRSSHPPPPWKEHSCDGRMGIAGASTERPWRHPTAAGCMFTGSYGLDSTSPSTTRPQTETAKPALSKLTNGHDEHKTPAADDRHMPVLVSLVG